MKTKPTALPVLTDCWNRIGVKGDGSCPELAKVTHCRNCPVFALAGSQLYEREPPPGYTEEWTERIARADIPTPTETIPVVLFQVGSEWLALDVKYTVEVAPFRTVRRVPHQTDEVLTGLVNIRGVLQLAVSLKHLLGVSEIDNPKSSPTNQASRRLLVAEKDGARWVFVVDAVHDIHHFLRVDLGGLPATVSAGSNIFTHGVFRWDDRAVGYLDPDRLFDALKRSFR